MKLSAVILALIATATAGKRNPAASDLAYVDSVTMERTRDLNDMHPIIHFEGVRTVLFLLYVNLCRIQYSKLKFDNN